MVFISTQPQVQILCTSNNQFSCAYVAKCNCSSYLKLLQISVLLILVHPPDAPVIAAWADWAISLEPGIGNPLFFSLFSSRH